MGGSLLIVIFYSVTGWINTPPLEVVATILKMVKLLLDDGKPLRNKKKVETGNLPITNAGQGLV